MAANVTTHSDSGPTASTTYYYRVRANNTGGDSAYSNTARATTTGPPAAPTNLTGTGGNAQVALSWTATTGATRYKVKRATSSGGPYTPIANLTSNSYTDSGLTKGTTYCYVVSAVNSIGESGNSAQASATPQAASVLGEDFDGWLVHDGWSPYYRFRKAIHPSCQQHLIRRCQEMAEQSSSGEAAAPRLELGRKAC